MTKTSPSTFSHEYDFGDGWRHHIETHRVPREPGVNYPRCTAGSRSGPPEDVGGIGGYEDFLEAWRDPEHGEHRDMRIWAGEKFDPERFDLEATNKHIARAMRAARGGYRFRRFQSS
jgi:hypothetical protein